MDPYAAWYAAAAYYAQNPAAYAQANPSAYAQADPQAPTYLTRMMHAYAQGGQPQAAGAQAAALASAALNLAAHSAGMAAPSEPGAVMGKPATVPEEGAHAQPAAGPSTSSQPSEQGGSTSKVKDRSSKRDKSEKGKRAKESSKEGPRQCINCGIRPFDSSNSMEKLCGVCLRLLDRVNCSYCQLDFHQTKKDKDEGNTPACEHCKEDIQQHGPPKECEICKTKAAFASAKCRSCSSYVKKYGPPVPCEQCHRLCAFNKPTEAKAKVGGKTLCLMCTRKAKLAEKQAKGGSRNSTEAEGRKRRATSPAASAGASADKRDGDGDGIIAKLQEQIEEQKCRIKLLESQIADAHRERDVALKDAQSAAERTAFLEMEMEVLEKEMEKRIQ